jgi:Uncharacterized conserved protein
MKPIKTTMLVKTKVTDNNNKFYEVNLYADGSVVGRNGRVGTDGVLQKKGNIGEAGWEKLVAEKKKGGYKPVDIATVETSSNGSATIRESLADIAKRDITGNNPVLNKLIDDLTAQNRFQLLNATGGQIDIVDGVVKTPVGPVTIGAVQNARSKLVTLETLVTKNTSDDSYIETLEDYLTFVPQKIPLRRGWEKNFFTEFTDFKRQNDLLDQLENSIISYKPPVADPTSKEDELKRVFGYSMRLLDDPATFKRIQKFYTDNINRGHASSHLKLKNVYVLSNDDSLQDYSKVVRDIGNQRELWHGTRAHNVLSILKGGLIIPTSAGGYTITGRMFGDGVYFSDQSSKSLNYAYGYWGGGTRQENCFMLLANVAMGKSYTPSGPTGRLPSGYHSMYAIGGKSGVMNNEMIVYKLNQVHLNFLCEFDR